MALQIIFYRDAIFVFRLTRGNIYQNIKQNDIDITSLP